jgi:hypothetical protein
MILSSPAKAAILRVLWAIGIIGGLLRLWQYFKGASLWSDEIALARNILERPLWNLLSSPLDYGQAAPWGFLLIEKTFVGILGPHDHALKLFPLISSLFAIALFGMIARRVLNGIGPVVSMLLFVSAGPFILFATEVKQYSSDVAAALLLLWLSIEYRRNPKSSSWTILAAFGGALAISVSLSAILVAAGLVAALLLEYLLKKVSVRSSVPVLLTWLSAALVSLLMGLRTMNPSTRAYMQRFWAAGFPHSISWPIHNLTVLFGNGTRAGLGYPFPIFYLLLAVAGLVLLWWRRNETAISLCAPIALALMAAVLHQYPFIGRLILFLVPNFMIGIGACVDWLPLQRSRLATFAAFSFGGLVLGAPLYTIAKTPPPYRIEDMKPVLAYLQTKRQPEDQIYVFYRALPAVWFYGPQYGVGLRDYMSGGCHNGEDLLYLQELDGLRGSGRAWIVITRAWAGPEEEVEMLGYLDKIGKRLDSFAVNSRAIGEAIPPAEAYLYDLSDPIHLRNASSDTFPIGRSPLRVSCTEGPFSMPPPREF